MCNCNNSQSIAYTGYPPCGCNSNNYSNIPLINTNCGTCQEELGCIPTDAKCVIYNGDPLTTLQVEPGTDLEVILQQLNDLYNTGVDPDYSTYNTSCLATLGTETQSQFVETISEYVCNTNTTLTNFISTTGTNFTNVNNTINSIRIPGTTGCSSMPIANGSTINQVLQILSNKVCGISTAIDVASVTWDACFTVTTPPTDINEAFTEVLSQICVTNENVNNIVQDTYKVKLDNTDNTEDYLSNKLKSSPCVTINSITDSGIKKLQFGLNFTPSRYNFNPSQFDVTTGTSDGCVQTYNVSLTSAGTSGVTSVGLVQAGTSIFDITNSPITSTGNLSLGLSQQAANTFLLGPITGSNAIPSFRVLNSNDIPNSIITYSKIQNVTSKKLIGNYTNSNGIMQEISIGTGLNLTDSGILTSTIGGGTVNSVGISMPTNTFDVTSSPITTSGTLGVSFKTQSAGTFLLGPQTGPNAQPTWRTMITSDIPDETVTYYKMQKVTTGKKLLGNYTNAAGMIQQISIGANLTLSDGGVLSASGGGSFTPNPCYGSGYAGLDVILPSSGDNGSSALSYVFADYTTQPSPLLNSQASQSTPQYIFDAAGNMDLLGNLTLELTTAGANVEEDILIDFADISTILGACSLFNKNMHKLIGTYIVTQNLGTDWATVETYLCVNSITQKLLLLLKVRCKNKLTSNKLTISLDGVILPLNDFN